MSDVELRLRAVTYAGAPAIDLEVSDPFDLVQDVWFTVVRRDANNQPLPSEVVFPARSPHFGVYEIDLPTGVSATDVSGYVRLNDGSPELMTTGLTSTPSPYLDPTDGGVVLGGTEPVHVTFEYGRLFVAVAPGSAASWRCHARRNAMPTTDGTATGTLDDAFLRLDAARDELTLELPLTGTVGTDRWCAVVTTRSASGIEISRISREFTYNYERSHTPSLMAVALPTTGITQRQVEAVESLKEFTDWLAKYQLKGYIGEVGWTKVAGSAWNEVAEAWFDQADAAGLWVTAWATGELWGDYKLQPYQRVNGVWQENLQAAVLEAHPSTAQYLRGLNVAGADFHAPNTDARTNWFSNVNRGTPGIDYVWNGLSTYQYLASQGHVLARVPFRWERIQPILGAALDPAELTRMRDSVGAAGQAGLQVILDVHNYGAYWLHDQTTGEGVRRSIGTPDVTFAHFADLWSRLTTAFVDEPAIIAYGLMNEPVNMTPAPGKSAADTWEQAAQDAVTAIRAAEGTRAPKRIMVGGYMWSGTWSLPTSDELPFITDPANHTMYEAHQYWDDDRTGQYLRNELDPVPTENWVRWAPNSEMWVEDGAGNGDAPVYTVEVFRVGQATALNELVLWKKGHADVLTFCDTPGSNGCAHRTDEYRLIATNHLDGSALQFAATVSGSYR
ncbi:MAG: cellulase family glycosylhydrolase [Gemmatimonadaceae bacterium]|nr:cellulase family glycosylhydrolase [Gemmatimonadaceae bacterium]